MEEGMEDMANEGGEDYQASKIRFQCVSLSQPYLALPQPYLLLFTLHQWIDYFDFKH